MSDSGHSGEYEENSLSLTGSLAMGTGVMIGAGIFALTGQVAEQVGGLFPLAFLAAAIVAGFSAYSYVKMAEQYPSAGGIATFVVNILGNKFIGTFSTVMAVVKIAGILVFAGAGLWVSGMTLESVGVTERTTGSSFLSATALARLAYKGFTTITNSGSEIIEPNKNIGRSIIISLSICLLVYLLVGFSVAGNLSIAEIIESRDYALAEAARPAFGQWGTYFTVGLAIVATISGLIASTFAVSRMLAMLSEMKLVPHKHFGMPGDIQKHTLVYTVVFAITLTILFDLSRIASLGAIFYIVMDMAVHWGVLRHVREKVNATRWVPITAIVLDILILGAFLWMKVNSDMLVIWVALGGIAFVFAGERLFLTWDDDAEHADASG